MNVLFEETHAVQTFGPKARAWASYRNGLELPAIVADHTGIMAAIPAAIALRKTGAPCEVGLVLEDRRTLLLRAIYGSLRASNPTHDALLTALDNLAAQRFVLDGRAQNDVENGLLGTGAGLRDLATIADRILFRSWRERSLTESAFGYAPRRCDVQRPVNVLVPLPAAAGEIPSPVIALWAVGVPDADVLAFFAATLDLRTPIATIAERPISGVEVVAPAQSGTVLARARMIVSLDEDPGTVEGLARFGRGLCAPLASGADEFLANVETFSIWDRLGTLDAVLRAQGTTPMLRAYARPGVDDAPQPAPRCSAPTPLVSIVMPTYSRPDRLRDNLMRLQAQTYSNVEIIVVNNDGTPVEHVVNEFPNTRLINRSPNTGNATAPRNDGLAVARGEFVTFLDDDDFYFPDHVSTMVHALQGGAMVAYSDWLIRIVEIQPDGTEREVGWDLMKNDALTTYEMLVINPIGYMTVFARKAAYDAVGRFDESAAALGGEELEMWLRLARLYDFVHVDRPTSAYTIRRTWMGQATAANYKLFANGFENIYRQYPVDHLPSIAARRIANLAELRKSDSPAPYPPKYGV
ncbi:MAG: hypothetical protein NVS2B17_31620 [Candidatus Velthaea sp.]